MKTTRGSLSSDVLQLFAKPKKDEKSLASWRLTHFASSTKGGKKTQTFVPKGPLVPPEKGFLTPKNHPKTPSKEV